MTTLPTIEELRPSKIICAGLNYLDHASEVGLEVPTSPILFAKWPSSLNLSGRDIVVPAGVTDVDYEAELGVLLGADIKDADPDQAAAAIAGYFCFNDVSARMAQFAEGQWTRAKSFDTFAPAGPRIVPAAAIADPQGLRIQARVNGETRQDSSTGQMIFSVVDLICAASQGTTLRAGDILATGTPAGVGMSSDPKGYLRHGDVVEVEIEGLGVLTNRVSFDDEL